MTKLRSLAIGLALLAGGAWPVAGVAAPACAGDGPTAALVVDTGSRVVAYCVSLDAPSVTGLHLIELAHDQHGLDYRFGLGGAAVCRLAGAGVNVDDCFAEYPTYWGYWVDDGAGGWDWSSQGAGDVRVRDGDLQGWVWGEGDTGETHDAPPATVVEDVCVPVEPSPSETPSPSRAPSPKPTGDDAAPTETPTVTRSPAPTRTETRSPEPSTTPASTTSPTPTPLAIVAADGPSDPESDGGMPVGLLLGIGLVALLGGAGFWRMRAGRAEGPR